MIDGDPPIRTDGASIANPDRPIDPDAGHREVAAPSEARDHTDAGYAVRRSVMGDAFVDRALDRTRGTESEALQHLVSETVWGAIWNRPGLARRDRSLLTIGMLVALRAHGELAGHVRGGLTNGLTREEITEAVLHASGYCGAPAALSAMSVVQEVFDGED